MEETAAVVTTEVATTAVKTFGKKEAAIGAGVCAAALGIGYGVAKLVDLIKNKIAARKASKLTDENDEVVSEGGVETDAE